MTFPADDLNHASNNESVPEQPEAVKPESSNTAPVDPFDPMHLGISTEYAAAINAKALTKPFELRAPNEQEFFRTSPQKNHHLVVGSIADKQDMGKVYVVSGALLNEVKLKFPKVVRAVELVLTQILAGASLVWPVHWPKTAGANGIAPSEPPANRVRPDGQTRLLVVASTTSLQSTIRKRLIGIPSRRSATFCGRRLPSG
jgi:hypothetical protein